MPLCFSNAPEITTEISDVIPIAPDRTAAYSVSSVPHPCDPWSVMQTRTRVPFVVRQPFCRAAGSSRIRFTPGDCVILMWYAFQRESAIAEIGCFGDLRRKNAGGGGSD